MVYINQYILFNCGWYRTQSILILILKMKDISPFDTPRCDQHNMTHVSINDTVFGILLRDAPATHSPGEPPKQLNISKQLPICVKTLGKLKTLYVTTCFDRSVNRAVTPNIYSRDAKAAAIYSQIMRDSLVYIFERTRVVTWEVSVGRNGVLTPIRIHSTEYSS